MIERITEEEERASEAIADLAGRNGISFKPLSPSSNDIRTLEHEGLFFKYSKKISEKKGRNPRISIFSNLLKINIWRVSGVRNRVVQIFFNCSGTSPK